MSGPRETYRYQFMASNGTSVRTAYVECDADAINLRLNGVQNAQAPAPATGDLFRMSFPAVYSPRGKVARARLVLIEFTGSLPPGRTSKRSWVPVFIIARYNGYIVGQTGTWLGLPVKLLQKVDGSPDVRGRR